MAHPGLVDLVHQLGMPNMGHQPFFGLHTLIAPDHVPALPLQNLGLRHGQ